MRVWISAEQFGANLFSVGGRAPQPPPRHGQYQRRVSIANVGALTANDYVLSYKAGAYSLTRSATASTVALSGAGTVASPLTPMSIHRGVGDARFGRSVSHSTHRKAAGSFAAVLTDPRDRAAGAVQTSAAKQQCGKCHDQQRYGAQCRQTRIC